MARGRVLRSRIHRFIEGRRHAAGQYQRAGFAAPREDCEHDDYEADILTGIASCNYCGHRWMQGREEIAAEIERVAAYQRYQDRENRRQWWRDLWDRVKAPFQRFRRARPATILDDDIPF